MADQHTPEAIDIPKLNPLMRNIVGPPNIVDGPDNASVEIYNELSEARCDFVEIQNRSASVCYVSYNSDCSPDLNHVVLAAGGVANDGLGGIVSPEVRRRGITRISVYSADLNISVQKYQQNQMANLI